jgi:creatinine amidohydrolase
MNGPFEQQTWPDVADLDRGSAVLILPVGAVEAHGPHLPLCTDVVIAQAMAEAGAAQLRAVGRTAIVLPPVHYTSAGFAAGFPGTISVSPSTISALIADIARSVAAQGFRTLVLANAHLDPAHVGSLYAAQTAAALELGEDFSLLFPDVTRKPWALRLTDEFKSGACHAGRYEGSIVLATRPELVRKDRAGALPPNPISLATAIRDGLQSFEAAGGPEAYFGAPAEATVEEGVSTVAILGTIVLDAVQGSEPKPRTDSHLSLEEP